MVTGKLIVIKFYFYEMSFLLAAYSELNHPQTLIYIGRYGDKHLCYCTANGYDATSHTFITCYCIKKT